MTEIGQEVVLEVAHRFAAPRERVFEAWTNPEVLRRWWSASDTPAAEIDLEPGGAYRFSMRTDSGDVHTVYGTYREVRPPERLSFTWSWEEGPDQVMAGSENSLVVVDFLEDGDGTLVKLTHTGFASEEIRGMHEHGWNAVLGRLEDRVFS
jgi:glutathione S-transferase